MLRAQRELDICGYYYGNISMHKANDLLKDQKPGTFLIRDSASSAPYALTFQQDVEKYPSRPANSIRIQCVQRYGSSSSSARYYQFRLDEVPSPPHRAAGGSLLPEFDSIIELVEFYSKSKSRSSHVLQDEVNKDEYPISLSRPLFQQSRPMSLQHLARMSIHEHLGSWSAASALPATNKSQRWMDDRWVEVKSSREAETHFSYRHGNVAAVDSLGLPFSVRKYLLDYPHTV